MIFGILSSLFVWRELEESYRLFNCALCSRQVRLCRRCDRGNIYCSEACSSARRRASLRLAGKRYQKTLLGRLHHAARQARFRLKQKEKVTHHGTQKSDGHGFLTKITEQGTFTPAREEEMQTQGNDHCHHCGRWCGSFARLKFWRGGREFRKLRRRHDPQRNRNRDSPLVPC